MISRRAFLATTAGLLVPAPFAIGQRFRRFSPAAAPAWAPGAISFDGSARAYATITPFTSDGTTLTLSAWIRFTGGDSVTQKLVDIQISTYTGSDRLMVRRLNTNRFQVLGWNAAGSNFMNFSTNQTVTVSSGWTHLFFRCDTGAENRTVYVNGSLDEGSVVGLSGTLDLDIATPYTVLGSSSTAANTDPLSALVAELWVAGSDLGGSAWSEFNQAGRPKQLGPGGTVLGVAPGLYVSAGAWPANSGSAGGSFTVSGNVGVETVGAWL